MNIGKQKCKILREIRKEIAKENDIDLITKDCPFQGDCSGTCPKCEAEVKYLEKELEKRKNLGKIIKTSAAMSLLILPLTGCNQDPAELGGVAQPMYTEDQIAGGIVEPAYTEISGDVEYADDQPVCETSDSNEIDTDNIAGGLTNPQTSQWD